MPPAAVSHPATRKSSRTASPALRSSLEANSSLNGIQKEQGSKPRDRFVEPPLAPPQPSYKDDNLVAHGVLSQMQALGTFPQSVKWKAKSDPSRPSSLSKTIDSAAMETETPETTPPVERRLSESRRSERTASKRALDQDEEENEEDEYYPQAKSRKLSHVAQSTSVQEVLDRVPLDGRSDESIRAIGSIIEKCAEKANQNGNPSIATALNRMFQQSSNDHSIHRMLCGILSQKPSASDAATFQEFIKHAKREKRKEGKSTDAPYKKRRVDTDVTVAASPKHATARTGKTSSRQANMAHDSDNIDESIPVTPNADALSSVNDTFVNGDATVKTNNSSSPLSQPRERTGSSPLSSTHSDDLDIAEVSSGLNSAVPAAHVVDELPKHVPAPNKKNTKKTKPTTKSHKRKSAIPEFHYEKDEHDEERQAKKRNLQKNFNDKFEESYLRQRPSEDGDHGGAAQCSGGDSNRLTLSKRISQPTTKNTLQPYGKLFSASSSGQVSRQATPGGSSRPVRKQKTARVKMSPEKKKSGPTAGIGRVVGGGRESPLGYDDRDESSSENDDECAACGGNGYLLCCDGCNRAFHFSCLDPPRHEDDPIFEEPWYCSKCETLRVAPPKPPRGLFAGLISHIEKCNTRSFALPVDIRSFYEGVRTGERGEFENVPQHKPVEKNRTGWDVLPDYYKLKDSKGKTILCWKCNKSALDHRAIITCDVPGCGLHWHLDCLDPPRANPPAAVDNLAWHCPAHASHDLAAVPTAAFVPEGNGGRYIRHRRPKKANIVDTDIRRGFVNNGLIEVELSESDEDSAYEEEGPGGTVYRLPEHGIKLDFIAKVKQSYARQSQRPKHTTAPTRATLTAPPVLQPAQPQFASDAHKRSFEEVKTAINMVQMSGTNGAVASQGNETDNLVVALIAEAPKEVVESMSERENTNLAVPTAVKTGDAPISPAPSNKIDLNSLSDAQKRQLKALRELIDKVLPPEEPTA